MLRGWCRRFAVAVSMAALAAGLSAPPAAQRVRLEELVSTCVDACARGCECIRAVDSARRELGEDAGLQTRLKEGGNPKSALTAADTAAQAAIVGALRRRWPGLRVVGEEDEEEAAAASDGDGEDDAPLRADLLSGRLGAATVSLAEVTVFCDPLDGTREFVEGRLDNVQCLVGLSVAGRGPVAGAVGLPFAAAAEEEGGPTVLFAAAGQDGDAAAATGRVEAVVRKGLLTYPTLPALPWPDAAAPPPELVALTGDSREPALDAARAYAASRGARLQVAGATGNKLLRVADGRADLAIMHGKTCLWDTCAPAALLESRGGLVTDFFGAPLLYDDPDVRGNLLGVVASSARARDVHAGLVAAMRAEPAAIDRLNGLLRAKHNGAQQQQRPVVAAGPGGHAADVARNLDGFPLDLGKDLGLDGDDLSYWAPESEAVRGPLSAGCRLRLASEKKSYFYKRVVMRDLPAARAKARAQPAKLRRDVHSFSVEAGFLGSEAARALRLEARSLTVPRLLASLCAPDDADPVRSRFALLLEDLAPEEGWRQTGLLNGREARRALAALAEFHAFFWEGAAGDGPEVRDAVWPRGAHWQPGFATANLLAEALTDNWPALEPLLRCLDDEEEEDDEGQGSAPLAASDLGARLRKVAAEVAQDAHERVPPGMRTLIHGDLKAANVFLRDDDDDDDDDAPAKEEGARGVALIDFQFCGAGLAATDLAHFICAALDADAAAEDQALLDHYHDRLCRDLARFGAAASPEDAARTVLPRDTPPRQYDTGVLDMCRLVLGYQWPRIRASPEALRANAAKPAVNSFNKNTRNATWLLRRCDTILKSRGL